MRVTQIVDEIITIIVGYCIPVFVVNVKAYIKCFVVGGTIVVGSTVVIGKSLL